MITETKTSMSIGKAAPSKCPATFGMYSQIKLNVNFEKMK